MDLAHPRLLPACGGAAGDGGDGLGAPPHLWVLLPASLGTSDVVLVPRARCRLGGGPVAALEQRGGGFNGGVGSDGGGYDDGGALPGQEGSQEEAGLGAASWLQAPSPPPPSIASLCPPRMVWCEHPAASALLLRSAQLPQLLGEGGGKQGGGRSPQPAPSLLGDTHTHTHAASVPAASPGPAGLGQRLTAAFFLFFLSFFSPL